MDFYRLSKDFNYNDVDYAEDTDWEGIVCSKYDDHQRAGKRIGKLRIDMPSKKVGDFLWTSLLSELIITDKVADILIENKVTGYTLKKAEVSNKELPYKLWEFYVTGWAGIAPKSSGIHLKESCKYCGHLIYSGFDKPEYLIDEKQWDGSDIFMVWPLPKFIFITEKVANLIKKEQLIGVQILSLNELAEYSGGNLSPGKLSRWMPEEKAKELGKPLGIY